MRRRGFWVLLVLPLVATASCALVEAQKYMKVTCSNDDRFTTEYDDALRFQLTVPVRSMTDFSWDAVYGFYEGTPAREVNAAVGADLMRPGSYVNGHVAVFTLEGRPVQIRCLTRAIVLHSGVKLSANAVIHQGELQEPEPPPS